MVIALLHRKYHRQMVQTPENILRTTLVVIPSTIGVH